MELNGPTADIQEYCNQFGGGPSALVIGTSCMCATGKSLECLRGDGKLGCGKSREDRNRFSLEEVEAGLAPRCVPDPCAEKDGVVTRGPPQGDDNGWVCDCGQRFCHDADDQPCPTTSGLDRAKQFFPDCKDCVCKFAQRAPKVNKQKLFADTCTQTSNGEFIGNQCKCNGWDSGHGVCIGLDGEIEGEGCAALHFFEEEGCEDQGDSLRCPSCKPDPCASGAAKLVPVGELLPHRSGGYACSCMADRQEQHLCFDGTNQPGCPDSIIGNLRWSLGFMPFQCDGCHCSLTDSFEKVSWAADFVQPRGQRFIYPTEDLCAERGTTLQLEDSDEAGHTLCGCTAPASRCRCSESEPIGFLVSGGGMCATQRSFDPLASALHAECRCEVVKCPAPGSPAKHGGEVVRVRGDERPSDAAEEEWFLGDRVRWHCEPGYYIVRSGIVTHEAQFEAHCLLQQKFAAEPPECGSLSSLLPSARFDATKKGNSKYKHPDGKGVVRLYSLEAAGPNINMKAYKPSDPDVPRMVEQSAVLLLCAPNAGGEKAVPDTGPAPEIWRTGMVCRGSFHYKHNSWSKEPTHVELTLVAAQADGGKLVLAAQETWRVEGNAESGPWMEVLPQ